jgi:asparagine N-glycosylation enzyme membrane subunit Stt3
MFIILIVFLGIAVAMHVISSRKNIQVYKETNGVIRSQLDLNKIKEAINTSMRFAMIYVGLFVVFIVLLVLAWLGGEPFLRGTLVMFVFGIVTLPLGLIGKHFEKKIRNMNVEAGDPMIEERFRDYLKMWDQPRFQLPE